MSAWNADLASALPQLTFSQRRVLAQYSLGMVLARSSGLSSITLALAAHLQTPYATVRERLRDWYCDASDKTGQQRREVEVSSCFPGLLQWVLRDYRKPHLALALDATTLGSRFVVLCVSVLYRACAIPIAWHILPAHSSQAHKPWWRKLLQALKDLVPPHFTVVVAADRGLYASWLFRDICRLGWHPFLRLCATTQRTFTPTGQKPRRLTRILTKPGQSYRGIGRLFSSPQARVEITLTAYWEKGCREPWLIATDLPPQQAQAIWYRLRSWIERGFKHTKSGGWNWQQTRMTDPQRAMRLWLVLAVAHIYLLRCGSAWEKSLGLAPPARPQKPSTKGQETRRILSVFRIGLILLPLLLMDQARLPPLTLDPEPWPDSPPNVNALPKFRKPP